MKLTELRKIIKEEISKVLKENEKYHDEDFDIDAAFDASPNLHSYEDMLDVVKSYEDESYLSSFVSTFPKRKPITKNSWVKWSRSVEDYDPEGYTYLNWIFLSDPDVYRKAGVL